MSKENLCTSIATDEGIKVKVGHFGDAEYYFHYTLGKRKKPVLVRVVKNIHKDEEEHDHHGNESKRGKIFVLNKDCDIIVTTFLGPGGEEYMKNHGLDVVKVKPGTRIEEALRLVYGDDVRL